MPRGREKDIETTLAMYELYQEGSSCADVGEEFGVTRQTVWKRFERAGLDTRPTYPRRLPEQEFNGEKFTPGNHGYYRSTTSREGRLMHRVVWEHFNGPIPDGHDIHHVDGDRSNNDPENLDCIPKPDHTRMHMAERA